MSTEVTLPALGESVTEGTISRWLKAVGETVEVDEPLLEVSTDKVDTEIPSPVAGTLLEIRVAEDETAAVGAVLALVGDVVFVLHMECLRRFFRRGGRRMRLAFGAIAHMQRRRAAVFVLTEIDFHVRERHFNAGGIKIHFHQTVIGAANRPLIAGRCFDGNA